MVREGAPIEKVYYVLDGTPMGTKAGRSFALHALPFIGAIGFLRQLPATTTGAVEPGAFYVEWPAKALSTLRMRRPVLTVALDSLLICDMATKMAEA